MVATERNEGETGKKGICEIVGRWKSKACTIVQLCNFPKAKTESGQIR